MPRVSLNQLSTAALNSDKDLFSQLRTILDDAERQLQQQTLVSSRSDNKNEVGMKRNDIIIRFVNGVLKFGIWTGKKNRYLSTLDIGALDRHNTNFFGYAEDVTTWNAAATRTKFFPNNGDWGFYRDSVTPTMSIVYNRNGTTERAAM